MTSGLPVAHYINTGKYAGAITLMAPLTGRNFSANEFGQFEQYRVAL